MTTFGSGSCPWLPVQVVVRDRRTVDLHGDLRDGPACSADLSPPTSLVVLDPDELDLDGPLTVRLVPRHAETVLVARREP